MPVRSTILQKKKNLSPQLISPSSSQYSVLGWAGLLRSPAPSAVSPPQSPVLNPKPRGTFSWPTSGSPFTPFLLTWSRIVLPVPRGSPPLVLHPSLEPPLQPHLQLLPQSATPASTPIFSAFLGCHSKSRQAWVVWSSHGGAVTQAGCLPVISWAKVLHTFWLHLGWKTSLLLLIYTITIFTYRV